MKLELEMPSCPHCGEKLDAAIAVGDEEISPNPGDWSICLYCASPLVFTDKGYRKPTPDEYAEMIRDRSFQIAFKAVKETIR